MGVSGICNTALNIIGSGSFGLLEPTKAATISIGIRNIRAKHVRGKTHLKKVRIAVSHKDISDSLLLTVFEPILNVELDSINGIVD